MKVHLKILFLSLLAVSYSPTATNGFNVDTVNYIRHEVEPNSMFGFSVALHKEESKGWVLIGAPEAQSAQPGVVKGGVVYRCDISDDNRCQALLFDRNGNNYNSRMEQTDTKSNQWFGATVTSAGKNGPIVACAPRYVFHTMQPRKVERYEPIGTCHMLTGNFTNAHEISPCRTSFWGYHRQGSCQAGLSAAVTKDGKRLFIGAPGSWYWQGQLYSVNTRGVFPYKPPLYAPFGEGQLYSTDVNNPENKVYFTKESTSSEDDSYLGYSTTAGDFDGDGVQDVAVGMPRGGGLLGKVLIFSWDMVNQDNITGEQIGGYFGYSLCACDVDGDGLDDLLIGAPMYTEPNNEGKYEIGRVYIMFQGETDKFRTLETRDGLNSRGRFGLSLASLGDMNLDGFSDFAVGAPYDGPNQNGAIYIYHGSKNGPLAKYSQVIYAEDLNIPSLSTFGFSLSGGLDLDGNLYPDLVVGAYQSSKAIFFKSRPVAVVEASTLFQAESKLISLDNKNCKTPRDRKEGTCTMVKSCLKYNGVNLPPSLYLDVSWVLDSKKPKSPRMFFFTDEGKNIRNSTMTLYRGKIECREEEVYITDIIRDKLTPLEVEMRYNLRPYVNSGGRRKRSAPDPVLDSNLGLIQRDSINIQKNCGPDNICIPDLRLSVKTVDQYLLGSRDLLVIDVLITNHGEDAFEAGFYMNMPQDLNFKKIERTSDMRDTPVTCTAPSPATNHTLKCDIGNPLSAGRVASFKVVMIPSHKSGMAPSYDFYMEANSTNPENEGSGFDNVIKKSIGIWIETDLSIEGKSIPDEQLYNISEYKSLANATNENDLGPHVVHMYNIRNNGPSTIEQAEVYVLWPYETKGGDFLMYLLNQPETSGNIQCTPTTYANQRDLQLDAKLSRKSFLESSGAVSRSSMASWYARQGSGGVHTEHSSSFASSAGVSSSSNRGGATILTEAEKRRLLEEENIESKGDASFVHRQRAQAAAAATASGGSASAANYAAGSQRVGGGGFAGNRQRTFETSWHSSSANGGPPITVSASRNRTMVQGPDGNYIVSESSTEHIGLAGFGYRPHITRYEENQGNQQSSSSHSQAGHRESYGHQEQQQASGGKYYGAAGSQSSSGAQLGGQYQGGGGYYQGSSGEYQGSSGQHQGSSGQQAGSAQPQHQVSQSGQYYSTSASQGAGYQGQLQNLGSADQHQAARTGQNAYQSQSAVTAARGRGYEGQANFDGGINRIDSSRGSASSATRYDQQGNYDSIDLEAQRQAYAQQSGGGRRRMKSQQDGEPPRSDLITGATTVEEMAQGGGGLKTTTFDLGVGGRSNVDDELRKTSGGSAADYYTQSHSQSLGGHTGGSSGGYQSSYSSYGSSDSSHDGQQSSVGGQYGTYEHGHSAAAQSDPHLKLYPRVRRDILEDDQDRQLEKALHCDIVRCAAIRCVVGPLANEDGAWIAIRTRLIAATMHKLAPTVPMNISTRAVSRVIKLPYIGTPKDMPIKSHEILFTATPEPVAKPDVVPLWVVILSACAGAIILLLLVFLLYMCGFFKRNRPSDSSERQPLNRNGNYHGDEHL